MSYIKKELLLADILDAKVKNKKEISQIALNIFEQMVKRQPDVDVEEIVRCRNCRYSSKAKLPSRLELYSYEYEVRFCEREKRNVAGKHFCSYGAIMDGGK